MKSIVLVLSIIFLFTTCNKDDSFLERERKIIFFNENIYGIWEPFHEFEESYFRDIYVINRDGTGLYLMTYAYEDGKFVISEKIEITKILGVGIVENVDEEIYALKFMYKSNYEDKEKYGELRFTDLNEGIMYRGDYKILKKVEKLNIKE